MTAEELEQAMREADAKPKDPPAPARPPGPLQAALRAALPSAADQERWRQNEARREAADAREEAERQKKREEHAARAKTAIAELSGRIEPKLLRAVRSNPTTCALFLGPTGCGKTTAAKLLGWLTRSRLEWLHAVELGQCERRHGLGAGEPPEITTAKRAEFLVIDDVGSERDTGPLSEVLDYRYSRGLPTIVTTGCTQAGLRDHIGAAFVRRIVEQHVEGMSVLVVDCHE